MRRAVLDPNVLISALLSKDGTPASLLKAWLREDFELVTSDKVIRELERALAYPKLRSRISEPDGLAFVALLARRACRADDPPEPPPVYSPDPGDDYLIALAFAQSCVLVSGDGHLLGLRAQIPVYSPAEFLEQLGLPSK